MSHNVHSHLGVDAAAYDTAIRKFIPGYDAMLEAAADPVAAVLPALVLDLGAGTGALAHSLLERVGVGRVQLVDTDAAMLERAGRRLRRFGDRVQLTEGSFEDALAPCDAVSASLALHHVPTLERKRALFARVFEALRPGGVFVNADVNMPDDDDERDGLYRAWADHMVLSGIDREQAWCHFDDWADEDTYLPLEAELAGLAAVGFDARSVWRLGPMAVVVARRPLT